MATPADKFPPFLEPLEERASADVACVARRTHTALASANLKALETIFARAIVLEDMALRLRIVGRDAVLRYLALALPHAAYGAASGFSRSVGDGTGGGFEWRGSSNSQVRYGLAAFEQADDTVTRLTIAYDGARLPQATRDALLALVAFPEAGG